MFRLPCPGSMALSFTLCASFFAVPTTTSDQLQLDRKLFIDDRIPGVISVDCAGGWELVRGVSASSSERADRCWQCGSRAKQQREAV